MKNSLVLFAIDSIKDSTKDKLDMRSRCFARAYMLYGEPACVSERLLVRVCQGLLTRSQSLDGARSADDRNVRPA